MDQNLIFIGRLRRPVLTYTSKNNVGPWVTHAILPFEDAGNSKEIQQAEARKSTLIL